MQLPHLFEFIDIGPKWLIQTEQEVLEVLNQLPGYNQWVANQVVTYSNTYGFTTLVELGAGTAPITRILAEHPEASQLTLIPSDICPPRDIYAELENKYPNQVRPSYDPVDFTQKQAWDKNTLLILSASFHHVPSKLRPEVLKVLLASGGAVLIVEPLRKTICSLIYVLCNPFFSLLAPLLLINKKHGKLRRFIYCWLCPLVPLALVFDGIISCLRMNSLQDWKLLFRDKNLNWTIIEKLVWQAVFAKSST